MPCPCRPVPGAADEAAHTAPALSERSNTWELRSEEKEAENGYQW